MSPMSLTLPDSLRAFVESQAIRKGYESPNEYLEALIRDDQRKAENEEIESKLLEALQGPPATPVTEETWEAIEQEGLRRLHAMKAQ
jgi:antitoxin ParD1/3/4